MVFGGGKHVFQYSRHGEGSPRMETAPVFPIVFLQEQGLSVSVSFFASKSAIFSSCHIRKWSTCECPLCSYRAWRTPSCHRGWCLNCTTAAEVSGNSCCRFLTGRTTRRGRRKDIIIPWPYFCIIAEYTLKKRTTLVIKLILANLRVASLGTMYKIFNLWRLFDF